LFALCAPPQVLGVPGSTSVSPVGAAFAASSLLSVSPASSLGAGSTAELRTGTGSLTAAALAARTLTTKRSLTSQMSWSESEGGGAPGSSQDALKPNTAWRSRGRVSGASTVVQLSSPTAASPKSPMSPPPPRSPASPAPPPAVVRSV
jgi:hypothetical protein